MRDFRTATENSTTNPGSKKDTTYTERVGVKSKAAAIANRKQDPPNVVTILPIDLNTSGNSGKTKELVLNLVTPTTDKLQIKNVRKIQGNGILVETAKQSDNTALMANDKLEAAGLTVDAQTKRNPRIVIYDVPRTENDEATLNAIVEQNANTQNRGTLKQQIKLAFKTGDRKKEKCNWFLEVSKEARDFLITKERLYIGWNCCRIQDYLVATQCYKCQGFGHTAKHCRSDKDICGHGASPGHWCRDCPNKSKAYSSVGIYVDAIVFLVLTILFHNVNTCTRPYVHSDIVYIMHKKCLSIPVSVKAKTSRAIN